MLRSYWLLLQGLFFLLTAVPRCVHAAGKGKLAVAEAEAAQELPCLEVLLGLPARGIARRSEGHLNQSLEVGRGGWHAWLGGWGGCAAVLRSHTLQVTQAAQRALSQRPAAPAASHAG